METLDQICLETNESEVRGYRNLLLQHKVLFCICFMTDILSIMNTLTLTLQKEGALMVDINCSVDNTIEQFRKLANAESPSDFQDS